MKADTIEKTAIRTRRDAIKQKMQEIIDDANKQLTAIVGPMQAVVSEFDALLGENQAEGEK